jgi:hypothetical protein
MPTPSSPRTARFAPLAALLLAGAMTACGSPHTSSVSPETVNDTAAEGTSRVVFLRPNSFGGFIQAPVFDGQKYVATVSAKTKVVYVTEPGEHRFMVMGENADFLQGNLEAGKTYFAVVNPSMGVGKARFYFSPQNGQNEEDLPKWLKACKQVEGNAKGQAWADGNAAKIQKKHDKYLPKWMEKTDKQTLLPEGAR